MNGKEFKQMVPRLSPSWPDPGVLAGQPVSTQGGSSLLPSAVWSRMRIALPLSDCELQIVQGIFENQKSESIAYTLGISPNSVNGYVQRIYGKLQIGSRPQLILRVMSEYLASVPGPDQMAITSGEIAKRAKG